MPLNCPLVAIVFHGERAVALTTTVIGIAVVVIQTIRARRGPVMNIMPLVLPLWFAAEFIVASAPGDYYGAYYISFVPIWASLFALMINLLLPSSAGPIVTNARMPPLITTRLREDANRSDWQRYVPLITNSPEVLIDMPLRGGTRFLAQYPYQCGGPDSPRGREFLADISAADVVVVDRHRFRLNQALEARIQAILRSSFTPLFDWSTFRFYARQNPP